LNPPAFKAIHPKGSRAEKIKLDMVLKRFVKAGLALAVAIVETTAPDGTVHSNFDAIYIDPKLPERTTEVAIRTAFRRWQRSQTKAKTRLVCS
jgi:hypothetical protein